MNRSLAKNVIRHRRFPIPRGKERWRRPSRRGGSGNAPPTRFANTSAGFFPRMGARAPPGFPRSADSGRPDAVARAFRAARRPLTFGNGFFGKNSVAKVASPLARTATAPGMASANRPPTGIARTGPLAGRPIAGEAPKHPENAPVLRRERSPRHALRARPRNAPNARRTQGRRRPSEKSRPTPAPRKFCSERRPSRRRSPPAAPPPSRPIRPGRRARAAPSPRSTPPPPSSARPIARGRPRRRG